MYYKKCRKTKNVSGTKNFDDRRPDVEEDGDEDKVDALAAGFAAAAATIAAAAAAAAAACEGVADNAPGFRLAAPRGTEAAAASLSTLAAAAMSSCCVVGGARPVEVDTSLEAPGGTDDNGGEERPLEWRRRNFQRNGSEDSPPLPESIVNNSHSRHRRLENA